MTHEAEYHDAMVALLEMIWGEGFMSPGGEANVARMVDGLDLKDKHLLDIGCGIGGPACILAEKYDAHVTGTDLEPELIKRARGRAADKGFDKQTEFHVVEPGPLTFPDETFDVVMSCGAITQTPDKPGMFRECLRVLKPGGALTCYEWMKSAGDCSEDMQYFFKMEGLTYAMVTLECYGGLIEEAGFVNVTTTDGSKWYRREVRLEYERMKGELYGRTADLIGQKDADHFVENWRAMVVVCEKGEMRQGYCRAVKHS